MGNRLSGKMFSFDFRKTSAWDYQRRPLQPQPTDTFTFHLGYRSVRCGHRLRHVGTDYGKTANAAHITTECLPTSNRIRCPHRMESPAHIDRNTHLPEDYRAVQPCRVCFSFQSAVARMPCSARLWGIPMIFQQTKTTARLQICARLICTIVAVVLCSTLAYSQIPAAANRQAKLP